MASVPGVEAQLDPDVMDRVLGIAEPRRPAPPELPPDAAVDQRMDPGVGQDVGRPAPGERAARAVRRPVDHRTHEVDGLQVMRQLRQHVVAARIVAGIRAHAARIKGVPAAGIGDREGRLGPAAPPSREDTGRQQ